MPLATGRSGPAYYLSDVVDTSRAAAGAAQRYLKQVWLGIVSSLPLAMLFAYDLLGANRLLYSSDHLWVDPKLIRDGLISLKLPTGDENLILHTNATPLFHI